MSFFQNRPPGMYRWKRDKEDALDPSIAKAMEQKTGNMFRPRCGSIGQLNPGETCPYCGYYLRRVGCGE